MRKIAFIGAKGGIGKTTSTILTATALTAQGETVAVIDTDPQGSSSTWADYANRSGTPLPFEVASAGTEFTRRKSASTWQLLDTPPGDSIIITEAIQWADLVIAPTRPGALDLLQLGSVISVATEHNTPIAVLLTQTRAGVKETSETIEAIQSTGTILMATQIPLRAVTARLSLTHPSGAELKASGYWDLATEIREAFG